MDFSILGHPAVLVGVVSAIVGLIVKATRLQARVDTLELDIKQLTATTGEQKGVLTAHKENLDIHFNLRLSQEVDKRNEQRFQTIEHQLTDIGHKLDKIVSKQWQE